MTIRMAINGKDVSGFHLTPLDGCLVALMTPPAYKKMATNENTASHGSWYLSNPSKRRVASGTITLQFLFRSTSLIDVTRTTEQLTEFLVNGKDMSGVNELFVPILGQTFRLIFDSISKYALFGLDGDTLVTIKFTEPNPANRQ